MKEGIAVYLESTLTTRGRGEGSLYRMMARVAVAEGVLETPGHAAPDTVANDGRTERPWAVRPYLFGYFLIRTLASGCGPAWAPSSAWTKCARCT